MKLFLVIGGLMGMVAAAVAQQTTAIPAPGGAFRVSGKVVNAVTGQPLPRAQVELSPTEQTAIGQNVETGVDGRFQFDGVSAGKWALAAQARGFVRQNLDQHEEFSTAVAVGPELQSEDLLFRLLPDPSISGTIFDEQGEAIRGAQVMLFRSGLDGGTRKTWMQTQATTDDQGHYRFTHFLPGKYFVAVSARPWYAEPPEEPAQGVAPADGRWPLDVVYPLTLYDGTTNSANATPLILKPGDRATADVTLAAVQASRLRIRDVYTDPTAGFMATLQQRLFGGVTIRLPGASLLHGNELEIDGLPPGQFELNLEAFGKNPWSSRQTVNVADNAEISAGTAAAIQVSGVALLDGAFAPLMTQIELRNRETGFSISAPVGGKGEFKMEDCAPPGNYDVLSAGMAESAAADSLVVGVAASGARVEGRTVEISGAGPVRLTLALSKQLGRVDGVAWRDGKPQAGVMIVLVPEDLENNAISVRRDQSDSDGTFSLYRVVPGRYMVLALEHGWDMEWMKAAVLQPYLAGGELVEVKGGGRMRVKVRVQ